MLNLATNFEIMHEVDGYNGEINGYSDRHVDGCGYSKNFHFCILNGIDGWSLHGWNGVEHAVLCVCATPKECVDWLQDCITSTDLAIYKVPDKI